MDFASEPHRLSFQVSTGSLLGCCIIDADSRGEDVDPLSLCRLPLRLDKLFAAHLYLILKVHVANQERWPTKPHRFDWTLRELAHRIWGFIWLRRAVSPKFEAT